MTDKLVDSLRPTTPLGFARADLRHAMMKVLAHVDANEVSLRDVFEQELDILKQVLKRLDDETHNNERNDDDDKR